MSWYLKSNNFDFFIIIKDNEENEDIKDENKEEKHIC